MDMLLVFIVTFIFFMLIWIVAMFIGRAINKKRLSQFRTYIKNHLPYVDPANENILIAKQKSKQVKSDIALLINETSREILVLLDEKGEGITHKSYPFDELKIARSEDQVISRGFLPKTYSFEERLKLEFRDGASYQLILENISNKQGNDQGADVVRNIFAPWKRRLNEILRNSTS